MSAADPGVMPEGTHAAAITVAVEVSARSGGEYEAAEFVAFALAALRSSDDVRAIEWSVHRARSSEHDASPPRGGIRTVLAERAARAGLPLTARGAAPHADVVFLASGPLALRATPPGVVTVLHRDVRKSPRGGRGADRLRRAAGEGVILHVTTATIADALVDSLGVERSSIAVAAPGIGRAWAPGVLTATPRVAVVVLHGAIPSRDHAVLDALRAAGVPAELAAWPVTSPPTACCVLASPGEGFPLVALEILSSGTALVVARTPTTSEVLEGAAALVDDGATQDFVEVALELYTNEAARAVAVAAGRARGEDFTWARRGPDLLGVVRRSMARL